MKQLITLGLIGAALSTSVIADEFSGARIGLGYSEIELEDEDAGDGFKIEVGYDFNKIIGINLSYEMTTDTEDGIDIENKAARLGADLGYAFNTGESFFIKPYITGGVQSFNSEVEGFSFIDDTTSYYGLGLRMQYQNFYTDISFNKSEVNFEFLDLIDEEIELTQTNITIGYKF
ncbi:hypothetical protein DS885_12005 [Psychromonas sp. B3M02]|uniref:porin family protein n=1 Tax=Psychromonas sp. B3M02 TaxID=2267226 RepID=UPI000DE901E5|nr:porin family protein [Psychromonas sp. B3M02]RBW44030.1 hypothetical protein DS885_12005 [Psychromonas sp. B3M02]